MAEGILKDITKGEDINIISGGIFAPEGENASKNAIDALLDMGIDIKSHRAHSVNDEVIEDADLILVMTNTHKSLIISAYPNADKKTFTLMEYIGKTGDISDPYGQDIHAYKACADMLYTVLLEVKAKILGEAV